MDFNELSMLIDIERAKFQNDMENGHVSTAEMFAAQNYLDKMRMEHTIQQSMNTIKQHSSYLQSIAEEFIKIQEKYQTAYQELQQAMQIHTTHMRNAYTIQEELSYEENLRYRTLMNVAQNCQQIPCLNVPSFVPKKRIINRYKKHYRR